jgi:hypothetical protein
MSSIAKVFIVLNFVLSVAFLATAGALLAKTDEFRTKYEDEVTKHRSDVTERDSTIRQLNGQVTAVTQDKEGLKGKVGEIEVERDKNRTDLQGAQTANVELRKAVEEASATLKTIQQNLASTQEQVASMQKGKEDAEAKMREAVDKQRIAEAEVTRLKSEGDDKSAQLAKLGEQLTGRDDKLSQMQTVIEMAQAAGFDVANLAAQPAINGKVLEVDSKAGVVVLSVGAQAEVKKGFTFHVYRGRDYIGKVMVDDVYPDLSAASVVRLKPGMEIQKMDEVTTRL